MNAKGTRFLAVLAVMAMAFAAFAVVDLSDAANTYSNSTKEISFTDNAEIKILADQTTAIPGYGYYVDRTTSVEVQSAGTIIFFVVEGKELTVTVKSGVTGTVYVGVYTVNKVTTTSTSTSVITDGKLYVKNGVKTACLTEVGTGESKHDQFTVPTSLNNVTSLADFDLFLTAGNSAKVTNKAATITASADFEVPAGWTLKADVVFTQSAKSMTLGLGAVYKGTVGTMYTNATEVTKEATLDIVGGDATNKATVTSGSVILTGKIGAANTASKITALSENVKLGSNAAALEIVAGTTEISGDTKLDGNVTIAQGATLNADGQITKTNNAATITNSGTINKGTGVDLADLPINGQGNINNVQDATDMETQKQNGRATQTATYPAKQVVVVDGKWTIVAGAEITIRGQLDVPEGSEIVIEENAKLILENAAIANIAGTIIINEKDETDNSGKLEVKSGTVNVYGFLYNNGDVLLSNVQMPYSNVNICEGGYAIIDDTGTLVNAGDNKAKSKFAIEKDAGFFVEGQLDIETIYNGGAVVIDSAEPALGNSKIYQAADDASVTVLQYTVKTTGVGNAGLYTLTITDEKLVVYSKDDVTKAIGVDGFSKVNTFTITPTAPGEGAAAGYVVTVTGIIVGEDVTSKSATAGTAADGYYNNKIYTNTMLLLGEVDVATDHEDTTKTAKYSLGLNLSALRGAEVVEDGVFEIGALVTLTNVADSFLTVYGNVDTTTNGTSGNAAFTNNGTMSVFADGLTETHQNLGGTVNAVEYQYKISGTTYYNYVSMDAAIVLVNADPTVTKLYAEGQNYVTVDGIIPDGVTVNTDANTIIDVGSTSNTGITLYVEDEAAIKGNGTINVYASMYAENQSVIKPTVNSDVKTTEVDAKGREVSKGWALWTNIYTALATAEAGDTVKITSTAEYVRLNSSVEVKDGVTLLVPGDAKLWLADGVTLTVNGALVTDEDIYAQTKFDVNASLLANNKSSAIKVNGVMSLANEYNYNFSVATVGENYSELSQGAPIAGAYFMKDGRYIISSIEVAVSNSDEIDSAAIKVYGTVSASVLYFEKGETCNTIEIQASLVNQTTTIPTSLNVLVLALDGSKLTSKAPSGTFTGSIAVGDAILSVAGLSASEAQTGYTITDASGKLTIAGIMDLNDKDDSMSVDEGIVYTGANLAIATVDAENSINNAVKIAAGAELEANNGGGHIDAVVVNGLLHIPVAKGLEVGVLTVYGTVVIDPVTTAAAAGQLNITGQFFIGMTASDFGRIVAAGASNASINGAFTVANGVQVIALNGSEFDELATDVLDGMLCTTFIVQGSEWFDAYTTIANPGEIRISKAPLENARLSSWNTKADGTGRAVATDADYTIGTYDTLYAIVNYNIYNVHIITDAGIKSVAIDGIQLKSTGAYGENEFRVIENLVAGVHTVSFTYESGYTGSVNLYTYPDGTILKDYKFTLSGIPEVNEVIYYQLSGSEQAIEPTPEPEPVPEEKEWTITTILLLILVILIAVMAVIVALRLNRN